MAGSKSRNYWFAGVSLLAVLASLLIPVNKHSVKYEITVYDHCFVDSSQQEVQVHIRDTVAWVSATTLPYSANFSPDHTPFHTGDASGTPVPTVGSVPRNGRGQLVTGDATCNAPASSDDPKCYFDYSVYVDSTNKCNDPGIRVVPPSQSSLLLWVWVEVKTLLS